MKYASYSLRQWPHMTLQMYTHIEGSGALTDGRKEPGDPSWYRLNVGEV